MTFNHHYPSPSPHLRYYFKKVSDEFDCGVVFEEVREDDAILPIFEEKIIGKVEKIDWDREEGRRGERESGCRAAAAAAACGEREGAASRCWDWYSVRGRAGERGVQNRERLLWKVHYLLRGFYLCTMTFKVKFKQLLSAQNHCIVHGEPLDSQRRKREAASSHFCYISNSEKCNVAM